VAGDHGVEVVDRCVHVHGAHAIDVTVGCGEGLDALLEFTGKIQQPEPFISAKPWRKTLSVRLL
jgi:hypothetical protein